WLSELESHSRHENYPGPDLPGVDAVADWLRAGIPTSFTPGLIHGDFHLANVLFDRRSPRVAAIVDWEMTTAGDPLLDVGWLIATWRTMNDTHLTGLAPIADVVARYA